MVSVLSPSQIDACAQSDYIEAKGHKGFLIGDQTGTGRVAYINDGAFKTGNGKAESCCLDFGAGQYP